MTNVNDLVAQQWRRLGPRFLPFADVATQDNRQGVDCGR